MDKEISLLWTDKLKTSSQLRSLHSTVISPSHQDSSPIEDLQWKFCILYMSNTKCIKYN
jgi:hypothetical protein